VSNRILGNGDPQAGEYIERWIAWCIQNPDKPCGAILVLQGDEGTGKGTLALALMEIFGTHALPISSPDHLLGAFSGHLQHCVFLFLDEAFWAGDLRKVEGRLKHLVTEPYILIEPKYVTPFLVPNLLHMLLASNEDWVVPAGRTARRYAVFKVSKEVMNNQRYFRALRHEILNEGGAAAMLWDLQRMDLGDWSPLELYQTQALVEQKRRSLRGLDRWMEVLLQRGILPAPLSPKYPNRCCSEDLLRHAQQYDRYATDPDMTKKLKDVLGCQHKKNLDSTKRAWAFPALPECRELFSKYMPRPWAWNTDVTEWQYEAQVPLMSRPVNSF